MCRKKVKECICNVVGNYWLFGTSLVLLGVSIFLNCGVIDGNNVTLVLGFVGILATFIVVSNYAQVQEIKREFEKEKKNLEKFVKNLNSNEYHSAAVLSNIPEKEEFYLIFKEKNQDKQEMVHFLGINKDFAIFSTNTGNIIKQQRFAFLSPEGILNRCEVRDIELFKFYFYNFQKK